MGLRIHSNPRSFLSLDRQRFTLTDNVPFHKSHETQPAFEDVGPVYFRLSSYSPFLNVAKWVFGHIKPIVRRNDPPKPSNIIRPH